VKLRFEVRTDLLKAAVTKILLACTEVKLPIRNPKESMK